MALGGDDLSSKQLLFINNHSNLLNNSFLEKVAFKACVRYFHQIFIFSPSDSPSKTMKNSFYFILKALFVPEIFNFLYFRPSLFFYLSAIALEDDIFIEKSCKKCAAKASPRPFYNFGK